MPKLHSQTLTPVFLLLALVASSPIFAAKASPEKRSTRADKEKLKAPPGASLLDTYVIETLSVPHEKLPNFNLSAALYNKMARGLNDPSLPKYKPNIELTSEQRSMLIKVFDTSSYTYLRQFIQWLGEESYNNTARLGPPGVGKTYLTQQLIAFLSYGVIPDDLKALTGLEDFELSNFKRQFAEAFLGKTQVYVINPQLLSLDNSGKKAMAKAEVRMRAIVQDLHDHAKQDYQRNGIRTIFMVEEAGKMPPEVSLALLTLADETGFKNPDNPFERGAETGVSFDLTTTLEEWRQMVAANSAIERRFHKIIVREPSEQDAFITLRKVATEHEARHQITIPDEVLDYIISMRHLFDNPPEAMPGGIIKAMRGLFNWTAIRNQRPDPHAQHITLDDAYAFLIEQASLPKAVWMPTDGRVPLQGLEDRVKAHLSGEAMIGEGGIVDRVVGILKAGRLNGFREMPVVIVLGPSGSGKDSLARAINKEMFGHDGSNLNFGVGVNSAEQFAQLFEGTPNSNEVPEIIKRLNSGSSPNGIIVLNEGKDLASHLFDKLKLLFESGVIRPVGRDSRARPLGFNSIFLMGQWGEELFAGLQTDEEIMARYREYVDDNEKLIKVLMAGHNDKKEGQVPFALIQRAVKNGGLILLPPVLKKDYIHIVRRYIGEIQQHLRKASRLDLEVDKSIEEAILKVSKATGGDTRSLLALTRAFTELMVAKVPDKGFPSKNAKFRLSIDGDNLKIELIGGDSPRDPLLFRMNGLGPRGCAALVAAATTAA